jgi:hypothetical protein
MSQLWRVCNQATLKKGSLISDECSLLRQAVLKKSLRSTFNERKQMSTKTSIKRIALVAVSALGFGLLSVMPAKASDTGTLSASGYTLSGALNADATVAYQSKVFAEDAALLINVAKSGTINSTLDKVRRCNNWRYFAYDHYNCWCSGCWCRSIWK